MNFLFVHQNFPGQYVHILRHLAKSGEHELMFISEPNSNNMPGVRKITHRPRRRPSASIHPNARDLEIAMIRADSVRGAAERFSQLGFRPDIMIGHHGWGEMLALPDIWPDVPLLGYFEFYYRAHGLDVGFDPEFPPEEWQFGNLRARNAVNHIALQLGAAGQTPTAFQRDSYPAWAHDQIRIIREGADLELCRPDAAAKRRVLKIGAMSISPKRKLITYVARALEPYRGFHTLMRALPRILRERPDVEIAMVGGDEVSYGAVSKSGSWRQQMLDEVGSELDLSRVHFLGKIEYDDYRALLRRSDVHIYLSYPFVASWSLREALATGCAIIGSDTGTVREFITDGQNGVLVKFPDTAALCDTVLRVLDDKLLLGHLRANARAYAERHLRMEDYLTAFTDEITRLTGHTNL